MSRRLHRLLPRRIRRSYAATFAVTYAALVVVTGAFGGDMYLHAGSVLEEDTKSELTTTADIAAEMADASERADAVADEQTVTFAAVTGMVADLSERTELLRDRLATFEVRDGRESEDDGAEATGDDGQKTTLDDDGEETTEDDGRTASGRTVTGT